MSLRSLLLATLLIGGGATAQAQSPAKIDPQRLSEHVRILSSDAFEGRGPATPGEEKTVAYLAEQFRLAGAEPAGENGGWFQNVTLQRFENVGTPKLKLAGPGWSREVAYGSDMVIHTLQPVPNVNVQDAPLVFVGYGIVAPERGWNDYAGVDMKGKVAVILVNDADFEEPALNTFGGKAMTYYGRWTYKFEEAARQGAAGAIIVHETAPAAYGWATVQGSWTAPQFDIVRADWRAYRTPFQGWAQLPVAKDLFQRAGLDFDALKVQARRKGFKPIDLKATASAAFAVKSERIVTRNVLARLTGSTRPTETVVYGAHWDHLGRCTPDPDGDDICNGAFDNATGTAGLIELARVFAAGPRPQRSLLFIAFTAEEKNLLGSTFYATNPLYPLETTVGGFNMDGLPVIGPSRDIEVVGWGQSDMEAALKRAAAKVEREVKPESAPEQGAFYRSDHFAFASKGVPMLYAKAGRDLIEGGVEAGMKAAREQNALRYHQPNDEWQPNWNWEGSVQDLTLLHDIGLELANSSAWPQWSATSEFKSIRDRSASARPSAD